MRSFLEILDALGGLTAVATALKLPLTTVSSWKARSFIPSDYWDDLVNLARQRGVKGITLTLFAELAAKRALTKRGTRTTSRAA